MKYFLVIFVLVFSACSSKNQVDINKRITSISLDENIIIADVPKTVKSLISIGLGVGGYISKHVGISMGTSIRPDIANDKGLKLQRAIAVNNLSLKNIIKDEYERQIKNDEFYKSKYVSFGAEYKIHLFVPKYYLDDSYFSSNAQVKIAIQTKIVNKYDEVVYERIEENKLSSKNYVYDENELLNSKLVLQKALRSAIREAIVRTLIDMKKQ